MIYWQPIETESSRLGCDRIYTDGHRISDRPNLLPHRATHWATINLPGKILCKSCKFLNACHVASPTAGIDCDTWRSR